MKLDQSVSGWVRSHPAVIETVAIGVVAAVVLADAATGGFEASQRAPDVLAYVLLIGQVVPFLFRRRYPFVVMYVMIASLGLYWLLDYPAGSDGSGLVAVYSAVSYGTNRSKTWVNAGIAILVMTVVASLLSVGFFVDDDGFNPLVIFGVLAFTPAAAAFGEVVYQRRQRGYRLQAQGGVGRGRSGNQSATGRGRGTDTHRP